MILALKFAVRRFFKTPAFTLTALGTLAICIGANLAIFAIIDAILLRPLPFPASDSLVAVNNNYPGLSAEHMGASMPNYFDRRLAIKAFASVSITKESSVVVGEANSADRVPIALVSPEFFATLGVPLAVGRPFTDAQLSPGADNVAILTDDYWRDHFNADPNVVGSTFPNDGVPTTVVGILPRDFRFLSSPARFYRPASAVAQERLPMERHSDNWTMIARLAPGATGAEAEAQLGALNVRQASDDPAPILAILKNSGYRTSVAGLHEDYVRTIRPMLLLLECGVLFLLLIGAVNLANLFLIRANGRVKEFAVRQALGAGRRHAAIDTLAETMVLAFGGGLCGLFVGACGVALVRALGTEKLPLGAFIALDSRVVLAMAALAFMVGLLLAAPILWFNLRTKVASGLQAESRSGTAGRGAQRVRQGFIVAQVALAFVLLSGAGLLSLSLRHVLETPSGFNPENILTGNIELPATTYQDSASRLAFVERLLPALLRLPGVRQAAIDTGLPFAAGIEDSVIFVDGSAAKRSEGFHAHYLSAVTGDYWPLMGIRLLRGRLLSDADNHRKPAVCVVDQAFADLYWPAQNPIGHRLSNGPTFQDKSAFTIVGVVADAKQKDLTEADGHGAVYFPYADYHDQQYFALVVRTALPPAAIGPMIRGAINRLAPGVPIDDLKPLQARIDDSLIARRSPAILAGIFAAVALLLAAIGTYGVLSYAVSQRQREIGVRMALGAQPAQIRNQFLSSGLRVLTGGIFVGVLGAWVVGQAMRSLLFNVPAMQAGPMAITVLIVGVPALLACLLPAHRATKVDPMTALRAD